jgi:DNA-directed RNA polymerase subunit RPC12/RpoP
MRRVPRPNCGYTAWDRDLHHTIFDHVCRPSMLHVKCIRCGTRAKAMLLSTYRDTYAVRCVQCSSIKPNVSYESLPPLYYRVSIGLTELWAWNREHLLLIYASLTRRNLGTKQKLSTARTRFYLRREWLLKRERFAKAIERFLSEDAGS